LCPSDVEVFNPIGVGLGRNLICFEQASALLADGCAHFSTVPRTGLKLLVHGKLPNNNSNDKQQGHEPKYPDQLFSICGITLFVSLDPFLPRNFIEFVILKWRQWFISGVL